MTKPHIEGSSKQFYKIDSKSYLMKFKDMMHGASREAIIFGTGCLRKDFSYFLYRILEKKGILTHLTKDTLQPDGIIVNALKPVKLEIIVRNIARGHWVDPHKIPLFDGGEVFTPPLVEFCLKLKTILEDGRELDDPRISPELALHLNLKAKNLSVRNHLLQNLDEAEQLKQMALTINQVYSQLLSQAGWVLEDFKFEVGIKSGDTSRVFYLIDEISPDSSRIRDKEGFSLTKDLFRQRRPEKEIYEGYLRLKNWMEQAYAIDHP